MWNRRPMGLALLCAAALAACGPTGAVKAAEAGESRSDVAREAPAASTGAAADSVAALGAGLYRRVAAELGNFALSPYSVEMVLAMVRLGAAGATRAEMDTVLQASPGEELDRSLNALDQALSSCAGPRANGDRKGDVALAPANAIWGQEGFTFEDPFLRDLARHYGAGMRVVDYERDAAGARISINDWASDRTFGRIPNLIPDGAISTDTRLVLTNALYFKAAWTEALQSVGPKPFRTGSGGQVPAPSMVATKGTFGEGSGWKAAEVPYLGRELSMVVIVPDDMTSFEAGLDGPTLAGITGGVRAPLARLQLPKFTFRSQLPLGQHLAALGMPLALSDQADLSRMSTAARLTVSEVFHEVFVAVDEEGTEAAAATGAVVNITSAPSGAALVVDRPFLFAIRDVASGAVLFLGRVTNPTAG